MSSRNEVLRYLMKKLVDCDSSKLVSCLTEAKTYATSTICLGVEAAHDFARRFIDLTKQLRSEGRYRMFVLFITLMSEIESNHEESVSIFTRAFGPRVFRLVQLVVPLEKANRTHREKIRNFLLSLRAKGIFPRSQIQNALKHVESCTVQSTEDEDRKSSIKKKHQLSPQEKLMKRQIEIIRLEQKKERINKSLLPVGEIRKVNERARIGDRNPEFERFWKRNFQQKGGGLSIRERLRRLSQWRLLPVAQNGRTRTARYSKQPTKVSPRLNIRPSFRKRPRQGYENFGEDKWSGKSSRSDVLPGSTPLKDRKDHSKVYQGTSGHRPQDRQNNRVALSSSPQKCLGVVGRLWETKSETSWTLRYQKDAYVGTTSKPHSQKRIKLNHEVHRTRQVNELVDQISVHPPLAHELPVGRPPPSAPVADDLMHVITDPSGSSAAPLSTKEPLLGQMSQSNGFQQPIISSDMPPPSNSNYRSSEGFNPLMNGVQIQPERWLGEMSGHITRSPPHHVEGMYPNQPGIPDPTHFQNVSGYLRVPNTPIRRPSPLTAPGRSAVPPSFKHSQIQSQPQPTRQNYYEHHHQHHPQHPYVHHNLPRFSPAPQPSIQHRYSMYHTQSYNPG